MVGALLINELVADSRGMVEKPMQIQFIGGRTTVAAPPPAEMDDEPVKVVTGPPK